MPTLIAKVYDGGGDPRVGDTFSLSAGAAPTEWNPKSVSGHVGRFVKSANESNCFFAFDVSGIPLGSVIQRGGFGFTTSEAGTGEVAQDAIRMGFVLPDGTWEINGFARVGDVSTGPFYTFAFKFPNDGTALPHASQNNSLTIEPGIMLNDAYVSGPITTGPVNFPAETLRSIGDLSIGTTFSAPFADNFNEYRNWLGHDKLGITLDSQNVSNANRRVNLYFADTANPDDRPLIIIDYVLNLPIFTTVPPDGETVQSGEPFEYDADAIPYLFGDQTNGNFLDIVFSLDVGPAGMVVDPNTGVVTWTPTQTQEGAVYDVTIRVTNPGDLFDTQSFQLLVPVRGCPSGDARARAAVSGRPAAGVAVAGRPAAVGAASGNARGVPAASGDPVVRSAVGGDVRHCPKE